MSNTIDLKYQRMLRKCHNILEQMNVEHFYVDCIDKGVVKLTDEYGMIWDLNEQQRHVVKELKDSGHYVYSVLDQSIIDGDAIKHILAYLYCDENTNDDIVKEDIHYNVKAYVDESYTTLKVEIIDECYIHIVL